MELWDKFKMDKSQFSVAKLTDPSNDLQYWLTKTPLERLEALEFLRQVAYGYDPATARLQRVFEIVPLEQAGE
jgi:hypothetical protein